MPSDSPRAEWCLSLDLSEVLRRLPTAPDLGQLPASSLDGFMAAPDGELVLAFTLEAPDLLDDGSDLWDALERRRVAVVRSTHRDERGRLVAVLRLRPEKAVAVLEQVRPLILLPARFDGPRAELQLAAREEEAAALERLLRTMGAEVVSLSRSALTAPTSVDGLTNEDWAFLGLVEAAGGHDAADDIDRATVEARLGIDPVLFDSRLQRLHRGLNGLVDEIFGSTGGSADGGLPAAARPAGWGS